MPNSLKCRLKGIVRKGLLSEKDLSRIYTDNDVVEELEKIRAEIQKLRNCSCSCSDGIIDDVEDILDKYMVESVELKGENK